MSDNVNIVNGQVKIFDGKDSTNNYQGNRKVTINITSKNNYKFNDDGLYELIDENNQLIHEFELSKEKTEQVLKAHLLEKPSKDGNDTLMFHVKEEVDCLTVDNYIVGQGIITGKCSNQIQFIELVADGNIISTSETVNNEYELDARNLYGILVENSSLEVVAYNNKNEEIERKKVHFTIEEDRSILTKEEIANNYSAVCALKGAKNNGENYVGSGLVIGKNLILTNKHCLPEDYFMIRIYPGTTKEVFNATDSSRYFRVKEIISYPGNEDISIAKVSTNSLGQSIGEYSKPVDLKENYATKIGTKISVVGYPRDKEWPTMYKSNGRINATPDNNPKVRDVDLVSDTYIFGGNSGGPIFNEKNEVIGVINMIADVKVGNKVRNVKGIRFTTEIYEFIQNQILIDSDIKSETVTIPDPQLRAVLKEKLHVDSDEKITEKALLSLTGTIDLSNKGIANLEGLQKTSATGLNLSFNPNIKDYSLLKNFSKLKVLDVSNNNISDLTVLKDINEVENFIIDGNKISDLKPLKGKNIWSNYSAKNQEIYLEAKNVYNGSLNLSVDFISDLSGIPGCNGDHSEIYPDNNGYFDEYTSTIVWNNLDLEKNTVSFKFGDEDPIDENHFASLFTGKVVIPIKHK